MTSLNIGSLELFLGCMYSGKTTGMVQKVSNFALITGTNALIINHSIDDRDLKNKISTHNPVFKEIPKNIDTISANTLNTVDVSKYNVIGIDETQFFEDSVDTILKWISMGKHIIAAALNGNSKKELFGDIYKLISHAENIVFCKATCILCLQNNTNTLLTPEILSTMKACFSKKISGDVDQLIDIGAADKYIPVCRKHYQ
jgi:thymidine kinase